MKKLLLIIFLSCSTTSVYPNIKIRAFIHACLITFAKAVESSMLRGYKEHEKNKISDIKYQQRHVGAHDGF